MTNEHDNHDDFEQKWLAVLVHSAALGSNSLSDYEHWLYEGSELEFTTREGWPFISRYWFFSRNPVTKSRGARGRAYSLKWRYTNA